MIAATAIVRNTLPASSTPHAREAAGMVGNGRIPLLVCLKQISADETGRRPGARVGERAAARTRGGRAATRTRGGRAGWAHRRRLERGHGREPGACDPGPGKAARSTLQVAGPV